jgi:hypothetical protein
VDAAPDSDTPVLPWRSGTSQLVIVLSVSPARDPAESMTDLMVVPPVVIVVTVSVSPSVRYVSVVPLTERVR